jgi:hypothetical protein
MDTRAHAPLDERDAETTFFFFFFSSLFFSSPPIRIRGGRREDNTHTTQKCSHDNTRTYFGLILGRTRQQHGADKRALDAHVYTANKKKHTVKEMERGREERVGFPLPLTPPALLGPPAVDAPGQAGARWGGGWGKAAHWGRD